jgi:benzoyl-CoA reductase/2-hydroxyglutaryl-CoA dehydratase subunit BcrC/BadD/HgdB
MSALETLQAAYEDPAAIARAWREQGGLVAACVGPDVPRELVEAAGLLPVRLRGRSGQSDEADAILGPGVDAGTRGVLAALLAGHVPADFLLLGHDCDGSVRLFTSLRALHDERIPETWFVDLLHLPAETTLAYDLERLRELRDVLGRWSGRPVTDAAITDAIREANETRRLLARVAALRRGTPVLLQGSDFLAVSGACTALPAAEANRLLEQLLAEAHTPFPEPGRRVYVTGSSQDSAELYEAIEAAGALVAGEDHDWGEALADCLVNEDGDPLLALADRYQFGSALARRAGPDERAIYTAEEAEASGAELVLAWIRGGDGASSWSVPAQRRAVEELGMRYAVLDRQEAGDGRAIAEVLG